MKKLLNTMLVIAGLSLVAAPVALADTTQNDSTETTGQYASASVITTKVKAALATEKGIDSTDINVQTETVKKHKVIVILTGKQKSQALIDSAVAKAKSVEGVTKVVSKLKVSPE